MKKKTFYSLISLFILSVMALTYILFKIVYQDILYLNEVFSDPAKYNPYRLEKIYYKMLKEERNIQRLDKLAKVLRRTGKYDKAVKVLIKMHRLKPEDPGIRMQLADILHEMGRFEEAELHYRILLKEKE